MMLHGWLLALATGVGLVLTSTFALADTSPAMPDEAPATEEPGEQAKEAAPKEAAPAEAPAAIERRWRENAKVGLTPARGVAGANSQPRSRYAT